MPGTDNVQVVVRCRPLFGKELGEGRQTIVEMDVLSGSVSLKHPKGHDGEKKKFTFDKIFGETNTQRDVYDGAASEIVNASIEGYNGTIFCYGQTGTGKTHTMEGKDFPEEERGILPHAFHHVFASIEKSAERNVESLVRASFLEIYNENVRDLLAKDQTKTCELKETSDKGVYVAGLTTFVVKSPAEMNNILQVGKKNRSVGATLMNADSSRSHSIFTVTVETSRVRQGDPPGAEPHITVGKLNLVDLAGSERQSKTHAVGDRLKEATKINLSLSALGNVISALVDGKSTHIPYRDSKLTRLLQDSLGGNTKTVMIANVGPADYNFDETMSTLRYANRAKNIKNKPKINEDAKDTMLREFQEEIQRLKQQIEQGGGAGFDPSRSTRARDGDHNKHADSKLRGKNDSRLEEIRVAMRVEMEENATRNLESTEAQKAQELARENAREKMAVLMEQKGRTREDRLELEELFRAQQLDAEDHFFSLRAEKEAHKLLHEKLRATQAKVVKGGTNLLDQEQRLVQEARIRDERVAKSKARAAAQRRRIQQLEDLDTLTGDAYGTIDDEIAAKSRKMERLENAFSRCAVDIQDLDDEFVVQRDDLLEQVRQLTRQIKLKNLILDFTIPPEHLANVTERCAWDTKTEAWVVEHERHVGNVVAKQREEHALENARTMTGAFGNDGGDENAAKSGKNKKTLLGLSARRLVNAICEVTGDLAPAVELASKTESEKMLEAYLTYDDVKAGRKKSAEDSGQGGAGRETSGTSTNPSRRARPGTARPRRRDGETWFGAIEQDTPPMFPVARGLVRLR